MKNLTPEQIKSIKHALHIIDFECRDKYGGFRASRRKIAAAFLRIEGELKRAGLWDISEKEVDE